MDNFERHLVNVLENAPDQRTVINFVKNKMLESYRNGISAAKKQGVHRNWDQGVMFAFLSPSKKSLSCYNAACPREVSRGVCITSLRGRTNVDRYSAMIGTRGGSMDCERSSERRVEFASAMIVRIPDNVSGSLERVP
jgi:hypothetical protein